MRKGERRGGGVGAASCGHAHGFEERWRSRGGRLVGEKGLVVEEIEMGEERELINRGFFREIEPAPHG